MMHDVPFESQYEGITDPAWQWRGCGITALRMVLNYWHLQDPVHAAPSIGELFDVGMELGAYREGVGWIHRGLVETARRYGYDGFGADYAPNSPTPKGAEEAWEVLMKELERGPVLASVYAGLDSHRGGGHIVVVTGFQDGLVVFNDPEEMRAEEGRKLLALPRFLLGFKRRFIVIRPR